MLFTPNENLKKLGLILPPSPAPLGIYKPLLIDGKYLYVSGHGPLLKEGEFIQGRAGVELTIEEAKIAARQVGLSIIATIQTYAGDVDKVKRVIKLFGMVSCNADFTHHPYVINGCSELFREIWGEDNGVGVRSAVGVASLPGGIPVEIEAVFELHKAG